MTENRLKEEYFDWMYRLIYSDRPSYQKLLLYLNEIDFDYSIPMDDNRASDGIDLRYRFGYEMDINDSVVACFLDNKPCSVLEMMVALSLRCEENIMLDPEFGNRIGEWFWEMIDSLGLSDMTDDNFDSEYVDEVIFDFMNHNYSRNGKGGLFTVKNCKFDMRTIEIWQQMNAYLNSIY